MIFFLFLVVFNSYLTISIKIENEGLKRTFTIPTGAPVTVTNDALEMLPVVTDKKS